MFQEILCNSGYFDYYCQIKYIITLRAIIDNGIHIDLTSKYYATGIDAILTREFTDG